MIPAQYEDYIGKVTSEKVVLAWCEPFQRAVTWVLHSGSVYKRTNANFVIDVQVAGVSLTQHTSASLSAGQWFYDAEQKTIYVRMTDSSNPKTKFVTINYRFFFSDAPYILTHDLTEAGIEVEYEPLIINNPNFSKEIDPATQLGISLESNGELTLINNHGFFDSIFDTLFWENKSVKIFNWFPELQISENLKIFEGFIKDKSFSNNSVSFNIIDPLQNLRRNVSLELFSLSDGDISENVIGTPKRRLYGTVKGAKTQSLDQILDGFQITGTISMDAETTSIIGVGTFFLSQLSPNDRLRVTTPFGIADITIDSIISDTSATASSEFEFPISAVDAFNLPEISYRGKNRTHLIAGHKLRQPITTVTEVLQVNRLRLDAIDDFLAGDTVKIDGVSREIKRITDDIMVLTQSLPNPLVGQTVEKSPVLNVFFKKKEFVIDRDYTISNTTECKIVFNSLAEFNVAPIYNIIGAVTFTNGSRVVSGVGTKFLKQLRSRDWIRSNDINHTTYYEILKVIDDDSLELRINYAGANNSGSSKYKAIDYIGDDSSILVDCVGKESASGKWLKTASDVVRDLVENDAGLSNIDTDSFDDSEVEAPFMMALKIPLSPGDDPPLIRDVINQVNKSVFGSLVSKSDFSIAYNVLSAEKPEDMTILQDDDLLGDPKVKTKTDVYKSIIGHYNHFDADDIIGEDGFTPFEFSSDFAQNLIGSEDSLTVDIYLANENDAETIVQRYAFLYSLTQSVISFKTKLQMILHDLTDKVMLDLDRLFYRFGGSSSRKKIGLISKIAKSATETSVEVTDLSNIFNRVATIAPNAANDFTSAEDSEKIKNGYIVDDTSELPDTAATTDEEWNTNLIG